MPGRWNDERDRDWQDWRSESEWRDRGRDDEDPQRWQGGERRSFDRGERVFGERESGAGYDHPRSEDWRRRRDAWRGAAPQREHEGYRTPRFETQDYTRGGGSYGEEVRRHSHREDYGYGPAPRYADDDRRFGSRSVDERYGREMRRPASGGTGGYDYERGYGDAGRTEHRGREGYEERAHDAGEFLRRTGQRISNWFGEVAGDARRDMDYREDERRYEAFRGARGLGPKGYKRSDERISDEVHQRLTDDPWLDASEIAVTVSAGEVTLSGTVESRESKHRAERIVEDLSGVVHVQNNLRIRAGNYFTSAGRGYGDSVQEAKMASSEPVKDVTDGDFGKTNARRT